MSKKKLFTGIASFLVITGLSLVSLIDVKHGLGYGGGGGGSAQPSATISVISPNGGEVLGAGYTDTISWSTTGGTLISKVSISYSTDGGTYFTTIADLVENTGSYEWSIPENIETTKAVIKLRGYTSGGGYLYSDKSDSNFTITANVEIPAAPTNVVVSNPGTGDSLNISWVNPDSFDSIRVYRSTDETSGLGELILDDSTSSMTDSGLTKDTTYYYTVRSVNASGIESQNTDRHAGTPTDSTGEGSVNANNSYLSADKTSVLADGVDYAVITVHARDIKNNPVTNANVTLYSNRMSDDLNAVLGSINSQTNVTDGLGDASFVVTSNEIGISQYTASVNNVTINDQISVEFAPVNPPSTNPADYTYSYVSQSSNATVKQGGETTLTLTIKNTGSATWYNTGSNSVHLGTDRPADRNCGFYTTGSSWLSTNRIAMDQGTVAPGELATFTFAIAGAPLPGTYPEYFRPVVENVTWMSDQNINWNINVTAASYQYQWISQSEYPTLDTNEQATLTLTVQNTGDSTWYNSGMFPIHLATDRPADRSSVVYDSSWLAINRAASMNESIVAPGEYATFTFEIQATSNSGTYSEYFRPIAENLTWMNDAGIYWNVTVR